MADLNGDETRRKILFCNGMLYDFKERVLRSRSPPTAWASTQRQPQRCPTEQGDQALRAHPGFLEETGVCLLKASENGKQVIEASRNWSRTSARFSAT